MSTHLFVVIYNGSFILYEYYNIFYQQRRSSRGFADDLAAVITNQDLQGYFKTNTIILGTNANLPNRIYFVLRGNSRGHPIAIPLLAHIYTRYPIVARRA